MHPKTKRKSEALENSFYLNMKTLLFTESFKSNIAPSPIISKVLHNSWCWVYKNIRLGILKILQANNRLQILRETQLQNKHLEFYATMHLHPNRGLEAKDQNILIK